MNLLYYIDKFTQWLDFSWLVTKPKNPPSYEKLLHDTPPTYDEID